MPVATLNSLYEKMGEVQAGVREAKHAANGASQKIDSVSGKVDALALVVANQGHLRDDVNRLEKEAKADRAIIDDLKADKLRREGAIGLVEWVSRNYPLIFAILGLAAWVGWANGMFK